MGALSGRTAPARACVARQHGGYIYGDKRGRVRAVSAMLVGVFKVTSIKSRPRYRGYLFLSTQYLQIFYFLLLVKSEKV